MCVQTKLLTGTWPWGQQSADISSLCALLCLSQLKRAVPGMLDSWGRGNSGIYRLQSSGHPFQYLHLPLHSESFPNQHAKALQNSSTNEAISVTPAVLQV